jgi:lipopolysaccharide/colanic/teichoic acid biosynthesis glycosyltransferase
MARLIDTMSWVDPLVMLVRVHGRHGTIYRESVVAGEDGRFLGFRRHYGSGSSPPMARVAFTSNRAVASMWQASAEGPVSPWKRLRQSTRLARRETVAVNGQTYDRSDDEDVARFVHDLIQHWAKPSAALPQVKEVAPQVWSCQEMQIDPSVRFVGPAWIGAGRFIEPRQCVLGPAALWDHPLCRPAVGPVDWSSLQPTRALHASSLLEVHSAAPSQAGRRPQFRRWSYRVSKRAFDIVASIAALVVTAPFYPIIMYLIWREDGGPFFFAHRRETLGGREFPCIKFRTMKKDAELSKLQLRKSNKADGPQFYMPADPRVTKIGEKFRRCNVDELPQFINVLLGHMSIIGPRPSPHSENQCCPAWREARLSVRPGITGLWQVMRTRQQGLDFQEWIRYDLEYVEKASWKLDLKIIWKTVRVLLRK